MEPQTQSQSCDRVLKRQQQQRKPIVVSQNISLRRQISCHDEKISHNKMEIQRKDRKIKTLTLFKYREEAADTRYNPIPIFINTSATTTTTTTIKAKAGLRSA